MAELLVEIATEELPARKVRDAARALRDGLVEQLRAAALLGEDADADLPQLCTPRRLAAHVRGILPRQPDREERLWGPPVGVAFGPEGKPTKAGEGFSRTAATDLGAMKREEKVPGKGLYLCVDRRVPGRPAAEVIAAAVPAVAARLPFSRTMRWPQSPVPFARPVRGLLVLLDGEVVRCEFGGVAAGRATRGNPFLHPEPFDLAGAERVAYETELKRHGCLVNNGARAARVMQLVAERRSAVSGRSRQEELDSIEVDLCEEVVGLVEWPHAVAGTFDAAYLDLPEPVLVTSMAHHLRFFPVRGPDGKLLPRFLSITDRDEAAGPAIVEGNERVLRARLYDAAFFFRKDRKTRLEARRPALSGVQFHRGLGTLLDKSERVVQVAGALADAVDLGEKERKLAGRAAFLLKCDLLTEVVKEFPELQGVVGGVYARLEGEPEPVARALEGQYLPRGAWDPVLDDPVASVVSLAEKTDSLVGYFSIGEEPTGSADPFGLRRHALGVLRILAKKGWPLSLEQVLAPALKAWRGAEEAAPRLHRFLWGRAEQEARAAGYTDFIDCVGAMTDRPFPDYRVRLEALRSLSEHARWKDLVALVERCGNMGAPSPERPGLLRDWPREVRRVDAELQAARRVHATEGSHAAFALGYLHCLGGPVAELFEKVLVEDPADPERTAFVKHVLHEVFALFRDRLGDLRRLGSGAKPKK